MTDLEFMDRAEQLLLAVEQCCDRINDTKLAARALCLARI